tara:strand:- start:7411 stop:7599 length:189 start_codon:yes stop_codon:yes gene_type:complete
MTFCAEWRLCKDGATCRRALTDEVKKKAAAWWPRSVGGGAPIAQFTGIPNCFISKGKDDEAS